MESCSLRPESHSPCVPAMRVPWAWASAGSECALLASLGVVHMALEKRSSEGHAML